MSFIKLPCIWHEPIESTGDDVLDEIMSRNEELYKGFVFINTEFITAFNTHEDGGIFIKMADGYAHHIDMGVENFILTLNNDKA